MRTREEQREERRKYEGDVAYEVWRSGGNPDRINDDRVENNFYDGHDYEYAARRELSTQKPRQPEYDES